MSSTQKDDDTTQKETRDAVPPLFNKPLNDTWTGHFAIKHDDGSDSAVVVKDDSLLLAGKNSDTDRKSPCSVKSIINNDDASLGIKNLCISTDVSENGEHSMVLWIDLENC